MSVIVTEAAIAVFLPIFILLAQVKCKNCWMVTPSSNTILGIYVCLLY